MLNNQLTTRRSAGPEQNKNTYNIVLFAFPFPHHSITWLVSAGTLRKFYIALLLDFITSKYFQFLHHCTWRKVLLLYYFWLEESSFSPRLTGRFLPLSLTSVDIPILLNNDNNLPVWCHLLACRKCRTKARYKSCMKMYSPEWLGIAYKMYVFWQHTILRTTQSLFIQ